MTLQAAHDLLKAVTEKFPPGPGQHHSLTLRGPEHFGQLELTLFLGDVFLPVYLDATDLTKPLFLLLPDIERIVTRREAGRKRA